MAIERERVIGKAFVILGSLLAMLGLVSALIARTSVFQWLNIAVALGFVVLGVIRLRKARHNLEVFESANGRDAGKQSVIR